MVIKLSTHDGFGVHMKTIFIKYFLATDSLLFDAGSFSASVQGDFVFHLPLAVCTKMEIW